MTDMADVVDAESDESFTIEELSKKIEKMMLEEWAAHQDVEVGFDELSADAKKEIDAQTHEMVDALKDLMLTAESAEVALDILNHEYSEVDTATVLNWTPGKGFTNTMSNLYGNFSEFNVFNLKPRMEAMGYLRNEALPDFQKAWGNQGIEFKLMRITSAKNIMQVGNVTVSGFSSMNDYTSDANKAIAQLYKMMVKMRHFILMRISEDINYSGKTVKIRFEEMKLFVELIIQKLKEYIKAHTVISVDTPSSSFKPDKSGNLTYSGTYSVKLSVTPSAMIKIREMYYKEIDYLTTIKTDNKFRRAVYWMLAHKGLSLHEMDDEQM